MKKYEIDFLRQNQYFYNPKTMQVEITNRCPLHCKQCYKSPDGESDMDFDIMKKILNDAYRCGVKYIMLNGGEPLLYPYYIELLKLAKKYQFEVACVTSGYSLTEDYLKKIKDTGCYLQLDISLNGSNKEIHELSRDGYKYAMQAIEIMNSYNFTYGLNWVSRQDNIDDFPKFIDFARKNNAIGVTVITTKLDGNGCLQSKLSTTDYQYLSDFINNLNDDFVSVQHCFPFLNRLIKKFNKNRKNKCPSAISSFCIDVYGSYRPCIHLFNREQYASIHEYWTQSPVLQKIRKAKNTTYNNCTDCTENAVCKTCFCMDIKNIEELTIGDPNCPIKNILMKGNVFNAIQTI
jgi:pyrroloquinoline quinone biosynthesis protein E